MESLIIVVSCHKNDYFLTRVCVASIKFFYPDANLFLLKDNLSGQFDTTELEQAFQVQILQLEHEKYGWGAAKIHFILSKAFNGKRVFIVDSDTVFAGRFLHSLYSKTEGIDFVVSGDAYATPYEGDVPLHYYDFQRVKEFDNTFVFPGYVFNTGHLIVTPGKVKAQDMAMLFDATAFPYYKRRDILPQVDQSLLNYLLPKMAQEGSITLAADSFMEWSNGDKAKTIELSKVKQGYVYSFLIHWAGVLRVSDLSQMSRADILLFFEDYYYSKVPQGNIKKQWRRLIAKSDFRLRGIYRRKIKSLIGK